MAGDEQGFCEELRLLADRVCYGRCEFPRERQISGEKLGELFGGIEGVVDVPLELVYECVLSDGDVELDQHPHVIVLVRRVRQREV